MKEKQSDKRNREVYLDVVCGIMIIWMILGHLIASCGLRDTVLYTIGNRLFPFFMPWFFFKSGMFYKKRPFKQVIVSWGGATFNSLFHILFRNFYFIPSILNHKNKLIYGCERFFDTDNQYRGTN